MSTEHERVARIVNATKEERAELQRVSASMAPSLPDFLLARITDDEDAARDAAGWGPSGRERSPGRWQREGLNSVVDSDRQSVVYGDGGPPSDGAVEHITRWDPARVLAECDAKRRIVEEGGATLDDESEHERTMRLLALPHSDHPDYREEWRP